MARPNSIGGLYLFVQACAVCASGVLLRPTGRRADPALKFTVFVSDFFDGFPGPAPSMENMNLTMEQIYGEPICTGSQSFILRAEDAPPSFCRYSNKQKLTAMRPDFDFDQYALERVMLAKWQQSSYLCTNPSEPTCGDIVVVPSLFLHREEELGYHWGTVQAAQWELQPMAEKYWDQVRSRFHHPENNYTPIVVMHTPFVWESFTNVILRALAEQPSSFVSRVALLGLESNIPVSDQLAFTSWGPLMLAMPYPTSLLNNVNFVQDDGAYVASRPRDVVISMIGSSRRKGEANDNWIRTLVQNTVVEHAGIETSVLQVHHGAENRSIMGRSWYGEEPSIELICREGAQDGPNCGLGLEVNMWTLTANSAFCLEPGGDSPTRSHFYVAVLSGCIPVIFDGGLPSYGDNAYTWWAWRRNQSAMPERIVSKDGQDFNNGVLDYRDFAVVFNASDIKTGNVDFIKELTEMPTKDPDRLQSLRRHLANAAPLMRYAKEPCTAGFWHSSASPDCRDAFTIAETLVIEFARSKVA